MNECSIKIWDFGSIKYPMDFKLLFLIQALVAVGVHDLYTGRTDKVFLVGFPAIFYILGVYISRIYYKNKPVGAYCAIALMAIVTCAKGVVEIHQTYGTVLWRSGYYFKAFTEDIVEQNEVTFDFILIIAIILSVLIAINPSKIKTISILAISSVLSLYLFWNQLMDGRLKAIIEALDLLWANPWGGFSVTSLGINTSHCMWLDYARDYGIIVFSMLVIFEIMTIVEAARFSKYLAQNRVLTYTIFISFIILTIFCALEGSPLDHKYIWYEGLVITGMMRGIRESIEEKEKTNIKKILNPCKADIVCRVDKKEKLIFSAICASLFTYGLCFPIINEFAAGVFMAAFVMLEIIRQKYVPVDLAFLFLAEGMFSISLIYFHTDTQYMYELQWAWVLPLGYLLGKAVVSGSSEADKRCLAAYGSLAGGMFVQALVDYGYGFKQMSEWGYFYVAWNQFWTKEFEVRITYELEFILTISLLGVAIYIYKKNRALSILLILANIFIQICEYLTKGRQMVMYMAISLVIFVLLNLYDKKFKLGKKEKCIYIFIGILIAAIVLILIAFYKFRFFGLVEIDEENKWLRDGGIFDNIRFKANDEILKMLPDYPLGGFSGTILNGGTSHNLWVEYARHWGVMPFVILVIFSILTVIDALRLAFSRKTNLIVKYTLFSSFVCINLYYFLEPNAHAHRNFWLFGLFISGMIRRVVELHDGAMGRI